MTTMEVVPLGERTLAELTEEIRQSHARVVESLSTALRAAIETGDLLREAQTKIESGHFVPWLKAEFEFDRGVAFAYMRLSEFEHLLPDEFRNPVLSRRTDGKYVSSATISKALLYLRDIGAKRNSTPRGPNRQFDWDEMRRLRDSGMSMSKIGELLGCSAQTVRQALMTAEQRREYKARYKSKYREQRRLIAAGRRIEAGKKIEGDLKEAYSLLRKCLQHTQAAHGAMPSSKARRTLKGVLYHLHQAEDAITRAANDAEIGTPYDG